MSPDDIAQRLGDRFRLLAGGRRTAVPRQQTLHALIDWSWDLLTEDDRRLLRRLSIFAGGWTAATAARIVGDDAGVGDEVELLDRLTRLVDRSLVIVDRGPSTRFRMLETIRQYAREKLIGAHEVEALADRHFAAFAALAVAAEPELRGPAMVDWLDRMDADAENFGAALEWGLEAQPWAAVRMANALLAYWAVRVASTDSEARIVAAIEIARARTVGNPDATAADQALAAARSARRPGSGRWVARHGSPSSGPGTRWRWPTRAATSRPGCCAKRHRRRVGVHRRWRAHPAVVRGECRPGRAVRKLVDARHGRGFAGAGLARRSGRRRGAGVRLTRPPTVRQPVCHRRGRDRTRPDARRDRPHRRGGRPVRDRDRPLLGARRRAARSRSRRATSPTPFGAAAGWTRRSRIPRDDRRLGPPRPSWRRGEPARECGLRRDRPGPAGSCRAPARRRRGDPRGRGRTDGLRRAARAGRIHRALCERCSRPRHSTPRGGRDARRPCWRP